MTELEYLAIGYVLFVALIVAESAASILRRDGRYRLHETIGNIGHGVLYQTFDYYTKALVMVPFMLVASHLALVQLPTDAAWAPCRGIPKPPILGTQAWRSSSTKHPRRGEEPV